MTACGRTRLMHTSDDSKACHAEHEVCRCLLTNQSLHIQRQHSEACCQRTPSLDIFSQQQQPLLQALPVCHSSSTQQAAVRPLPVELMRRYAQLVLACTSVSVCSDIVTTSISVLAECKRHCIPAWKDQKSEKQLAQRQGRRSQAKLHPIWTDMTASLASPAAEYCASLILLSILEPVFYT